MIDLMQGDCLEIMKEIPSDSIDLILCDLPYGTTACAWDEIIPLNELFEQYKRVVRNNGFIVLFGSQPFTTKLISSNIDQFSHQWIWEKEQGTNPLLANMMPLKNFEDIVVFYNDYKKYDYELKNPLREYFYKILCYLGENNKQIANKLGHRHAEHSFYVLPKKEIIDKIGQKIDHVFRYGSTQFGLCTEKTYLELLDVYGLNKVDFILPYQELKKINDEFKKELLDYPRIYNPQMVKTSKGVKSCGGNNPETIGVNLIGDKKLRFEKYPNSIIKFKRDKSGLHPTQKPVKLMEYLIKTYSNESNLVLDNCMGSGTTGVACKNLDRNFIGIELDEKYFGIAKKRIENSGKQQILRGARLMNKQLKGGLWLTSNGRIVLDNHNNEMFCTPKDIKLCTAEELKNGISIKTFKKKLKETKRDD